MESYRFYQNKFFSEYKLRWITHPRQMQIDSKKWDIGKNILYLPIKEQSKYADYVTKKMCNLDESIVVSFAEGEILNLRPIWSNACSIGNIAHIIQSLERFPTQKDFKNKLLSIFEDYCNVLIDNL